MTITTNSTDFVAIGKIGRPFGVQGWSKIYSFTEPVVRILEYSPWYLKRNDSWQADVLKATRWNGTQLIGKFAGCDTPEQAKFYTNLLIGTASLLLNDKADSEYYWQELTGLRVKTTHGISLGKIDHLLATGANDVMVIKGEKEYILPYVPNEVVVKIDLTQGEMTVNWDPGFCFK